MNYFSTNKLYFLQILNAEYRILNVSEHLGLLGYMENCEAADQTMQITRVVHRSRDDLTLFIIILH